MIEYLHPTGCGSVRGEGHQLGLGAAGKSRLGLQVSCVRLRRLPARRSYAAALVLGNRCGECSEGLVKQGSYRLAAPGSSTGTPLGAMPPSP